MQTKPNNQTEQPSPKGATVRRRLMTLVLTLLLGTTGLFTSARPVAAMGAGGVTVGTGNSSCAVVNGGVKCWGSNDTGQLGDGTTTNRTTPVDVIGLTSGVATISVGVNYACAVTTTGGAKCWGYNALGHLGDGTTTSRTTPVDVVGLTSGVVAIAAGWGTTCALTSAGGVKCWGTGSGGQLGDGTTTAYRTTPADVVGLTSGVTGISVGFSTACALTSAGGVKCWGANTSGQLGDGTTTNRSTPVNVVGLSSGVTGISVGIGTACAVTSTGTVKCWGANTNGQLGIGSIDALPHPVPVFAAITGNAVFVNIGYDTACAVMSDGTAQCWGNDLYGKAGIGYLSTNKFPYPKDVVGGGFITIDTSVAHSCAATTSGVRCTGLIPGVGIADTLPTSTYVYAFVGVSGLGSSGVGIPSTPGTTNLAVTKTASVSSATTGTPFNYTVTVTNNGAAAATNVNINDKLPANVTYNSATPSAGGSCGAPSAGVLTCTWPTVAAGASVNVVINVTP